MTDMRIIPLDKTEPRVETGAVQFGDDWPGVFIRGDRAGWIAEILRQELEANPTAFDCQRHEIECLIRTIHGDVIVK